MTAQFRKNNPSFFWGFIFTSFLLTYFLVLPRFQARPNIDRIKNRDGSEKILILSTIAPIGAIVDTLVGDLALTACLISPNIDPHSYQIKKGDADLFAQAAFVFYNGLGLEHGPSLFSDLRDKQTAFSVGDYLLENAETSGQILWSDGVPDPHIWLDLSLLKKAICPMAKWLMQLLPHNQALIQTRALKLTERFEKFDRIIRDLVLSIPSSKRYLVSEHSAFGYFVKSYLASVEERTDGTWSERYIAPQGFAPDAQLSFLQIQKVFDFVLLRGVDVVFPEVNVAPIALEKILVMARNKNGYLVAFAKDALYSDCFPDFFQKFDSAGAYLDMLLHNAHVIKAALHGGI